MGRDVFGSPVDADAPLITDNVMLGLNPIEPSFSGESSLTAIGPNLKFASPMSHMVTSSNIGGHSTIVM